MRQTYVLRFEIFDAHTACDLRHGIYLDDSGLSLNTQTGLPLAIDREARELESSAPADDIFVCLARPFERLRAAPSLRPADHTFKPTIDRVVPLFEPLRQLDYRFGPIHLDWQDMQDQGAVAGRLAPEIVASGTLHLGIGVVQLWRETDPISAECTILGVLSIPPVMTIADFLVFVQPGVASISQIRIIRDAMPNRCMALLKFRSAEDAAVFQDEYDAKPFGAMLDDEICHIVRIKAIEMLATTSPPFTFPQEGDSTSNNLAGCVELPTCPVCLERMDSSVTGLATILCGHQFHCSCLQRWTGSKCPVCRYSQARTAKTSPEEMQVASTCEVCHIGASGESLWMCLLCGHVGCGRYQGGHAAAHFDATMHLYAIELDSQRVWDYAGDNYVHRLIQNRADGKLVELPSRFPENDESPPRVPSGGPNRATRQAQEKAEAMGLEYQQLLSSQLASQRAYYSDIVTQLKHEISAMETKAQDEASRYESKARQAEKASELARTLQKELASEHEITKGLLANLQKLRAEHSKDREEMSHVKVEVADLREQLRDLIFTLEARDKIETTSTELAGGSLFIPSTEKPGPRRNRRR